jgi:DNA-binding Xre family transcriptional regulator
MLDKTDKKYHSYHITQRFLFAVDRIVGNRSNGKITYKEISSVIGMTSSNLIRLRESTGENCVTVEAIGRLCDTYKISASWLILDVGNMYADIEIMAAYNTLEKRVSITEYSIKQIEVSIGIVKAKK